MQEHAGGIAKWLETCTYGFSFSITIGGIVELIDHHTWIVGAVGMTLSFIATVIFKFLDYRLRVKRLEQSEAHRV